MKKFFVIFCERNLYRPQLYKSMQSIRKKKYANPQLKFQQFSNQLEAQKFMYPKKIAYLMVQQNIDKELSPIQQQKEVSSLEQMQSQIIIQSNNLEKQLQIMTKQTSMQEVTRMKIKSLYQEIYSYQGSQKFVKSKPLINIKSNVEYYGFFDGASRGNPGKSGAGYALLNISNQKIFTNSINLGTKTNNQAEFFSLVYLLLDCKQNRVNNLKVFGDSQLVVKTIKGIYSIKDQKLKYIAYLSKYLTKSFQQFQIQHIPRQSNTLADKLSNQGIIKKKYYGKMHQFVV